MSSCAASCYTCFPKVSCAFATSASWPTGDAPRSCHFASISSAQRRRQSKTYPAAKTPVIFGYAQNAVHRCRSSQGLRLPKSNFVLLLPWSPHETTLYSTNPLRASARSVSLRIAVLQTRAFYFLKASLHESLARSSTFHLSLSTVVFSRAAPAHLDTAPTLN